MYKYALLVNDDGYKHYTVLEAKKNGCSVPNIGSGLIRRLFEIHNSEPLNRYFELPLKQIWFYRCYDSSMFNEDDDIVFLLYESFHMSYSRKLLKHIRHRYKNSKIIYYFSNPANEYNLKRLSRIRDLVDGVFSFNKADAEKYGFIYFTMDPFILPKLEARIDEESDLFFVGTDKGRLDVLIKVFERFHNAGMKCDFWIVGVPEAKQQYRNIIHYNQRLTYEEVLQKDANTKCILEILQDDNRYYSIKTAEALQYHRKLLTSNTSVLSEWFYDSEIIQAFYDVGDIDIDFVRNVVSEEKYKSLDMGSFERFRKSIELILDAEDNAIRNKAY